MMAASNAAHFSLAQLLDGIAPVDARDDVAVAGLSLDSRDINPGDCFVALAGAQSHGAQFAHAAVAAGAQSVLVDGVEISMAVPVPIIRINELRQHLGTIASRFFSAPSEALDIYAVTGTNGKTTIAYLIAQALKSMLGSAGYCGTLGFGEIDELHSSVNTTPDPITLQSLMAELRAAQCGALALEVSSHALCQHRVSDTAIDVAIFTNLGHDHLDYHDSLEDYAQAKKSLFMRAGLKQVVVNIDDPVGLEIAHAIDPAIDCWTVSASAAPSFGSQHVKILAFTSSGEGSELQLDIAGETCVIRTPLIGDFNAMNLASAAAALCAHGHAVGDVVTALSLTTGVVGRMELIPRPNAADPCVVIDYAHTPESLSAALSALRDISTRRLICVFGCGGDRDQSKRHLMGAAAERGADAVILTSDNPRGEANSAIVDEILGGMKDPQTATVIHDRKSAIVSALAYAGEGDVVLIAGKGHETYQETNGQRIAFSDRAIAQSALTRGNT